MCVLYTGAKTLFTVANVNEWQKWFLLLYWFANQLKTYNSLGQCAAYASVSGHRVKQCENILSDFI